MELSKKSQKNLTLLFKIFFIGLLLQFFLQTFVTFELGLEGGFWSVVWAWKELLIMGFAGIVGRNIFKRHNFKKFREEFPLKRFFWAFVGTLAIVFFVSLVINQSGLSLTIMSVRYTFSGFFIFLVVSALARLLLKDKSAKILFRYEKIMKTLLRGGLLRRCVIRIAPRTLDFVGYNMYNYEGDIGAAPPAAYYTHINQGLVRNQFLFERPISWGFFLIAFWPLFFVFMVKNRSAWHMFFWGGMYGLNIFLTFSRAARGARVIITFFLLLMEYRKQFWKLSVYLFLPLLALFAGAIYVGKDQIISREYSNTGHKELVLEAVQKISDRPIWGEGAGTAGPVTHHNDDIPEYNPENQFLQIWIEYGLFGFVGWMILFAGMILMGVPAYRIIHAKKTSKHQKHAARILFAMSLGLFGLAIEGMVLHSFVDRMIVYPFAAAFALAYINFLQHNPRGR